MLKIDEDHEKKHKQIEAKLKFFEGMVDELIEQVDELIEQIDELIEQVGLKKAKGKQTHREPHKRPG